jgi:hypothetical protein
VLTFALLSVPLRARRMPHALHSTGFPLGPLRHKGELTAPQWQQGPAKSCFAVSLRLLASSTAAALGLSAKLGVNVGLWATRVWLLLMLLTLLLLIGEPR